MNSCQHQRNENMKVFYYEPTIKRRRGKRIQEIEKAMKKRNYNVEIAQWRILWREIKTWNVRGAAKFLSFSVYSHFSISIILDYNFTFLLRSYIKYTYLKINMILHDVVFFKTIFVILPFIFTNLTNKLCFPNVSKKIAKLFLSCLSKHNATNIYAFVCTAKRT